MKTSVRYLRITIIFDNFNENIMVGKRKINRFRYQASDQHIFARGLFLRTALGLLHILFISLLLSLLSCDKIKGVPNGVKEELIADTTKTPNSGQGAVPPQETQEDVILLGSGTGNLVIDGRSLAIGENTIIAIKAGAYGSITIQHIEFDNGKPLRIVNDGQVWIGEAMYTRDIENVHIAGNGNSDIPYGFKFDNIAYRAIVLEGNMSGVTLGNMSFRNVRDYVISRSNADNDRHYDGTPTTGSAHFKILNCEFENTGQIIFGGNLNKGDNDDSGFISDVEIAYNTFKNTDWGTLVSFSNVQHYDIHHNVVTDVNQNNNDHNGIFFMQGNGTFHDNKLINYQGNALRAWVYSRGSTPATIEIYNNICYNTRKYSAFELQQFDRNLWADKSTHVNAKVYNNTVGKMNTSKDWEGQILDLYYISGTLEYYNNLGFELSSSKSVTNMINNMGDTEITVESNNKYFSNLSGAVNNASDLISNHNGIGAAIAWNQ
ncbi:hypothetical protein [Parapedobacter sp. DT-150]|uniref:hypothetical protein n=1 Tax=Parapedobacter sp. DT-150 TaxID=3396162 RepID=UPI003F1C6B00